jgi:hypothetical protein
MMICFSSKAQVTSFTTTSGRKRIKRRRRELSKRGKPRAEGR